MAKKKYFIFYVTLLLMLFLGLSGTCYASNLTENNVKNFMYFIMVDGYDYDPTWTYNYLENIDFNHYPSSNTNLVSSFLANDSYTCNMFLQGDTIYITFNDKYNSYGKIVQQDNYYYNIPYFKYIGIQIKTDSSTNKTGIVSTIERLNAAGSIGTYAPARHFENNVYYSSTPSVMKQEAPVNWCNANTFGQATVNIYSPFIDLEDLYFQFREHTNEISLLSVDNIPYININNNNYYLGTLFNHDNTIPRWFASDYLEIFYYDNNWNNSYKLMERTFINEDGEFVNNITDSNRYLDIIYDSTEREYKYYLKSPYIYYNMLYHYELEYIENYNVVKHINVYWYNYNNRTIVTSGTIDDTTFDNYGSYLDQIKDLPIIQNNNENTDNIIDNMNDDDNVNLLIGESLSSGDILAKLQFQHYHISGDDIVYNLFTNIADVLLDDEDVYFDYSMHGEPPTRIYASAFTTPDNKLTQFIRIFLVFVVMYGIYYNIKHIIDLINEGKAPLILEDEDVDVMLYKM